MFHTPLTLISMARYSCDNDMHIDPTIESTTVIVCSDNGRLAQSKGDVI